MKWLAFFLTGFLCGSSAQAALLYDCQNRHENAAVRLQFREGVFSYEDNLIRVHFAGLSTERFFEDSDMKVSWQVDQGIQWSTMKLEVDDELIFEFHHTLVPDHAAWALLRDKKTEIRLSCE